MSFLWNRIVNSPGNRILLSQGGSLILTQPGQSPGAYNLAQLQAKVWHLLRIDGPANGFPPPDDPNSDFPPSIVQMDLNTALAQFIADVGFRPKISDRMDTFPVLPLLDVPVPPGLISLKKIEYTALGAGGGTTYALTGLSLQDFDNRTGGAVWPTNTGQPWFYREIYAGQVRFWQPPGPSQAASAGEGYYYVNGIPVPGDLVVLTLTNGGTTVTIPVVAGAGNAQDLATQIAGALQQNTTVSEWLTAQVSPVNGTAIQLFVQNLDPVTFFATTTQQPGSTLRVDPTTTTTVTTVGDTYTWYYSTNGTTLALPGDVPGIPQNFHVALVYRVLSDYWDRKEDPGQADRYMKRYEGAVKAARGFTFDSDQEMQPTLAGYEFDGYAWVNGGLGSLY